MDEFEEMQYAQEEANDVVKNGVEIPLKDNPEEVIVLDFDNLPAGEEVLTILRQEQVALHVWLKLAVAYYRHGQVPEFVSLLEACGSDASLKYAHFEEDQMCALDTLAAHYVNCASREKGKERRRELFSKATLLYTTADKITMYNLSHLLGRAYFCLLEDEEKMDHADSQFNFVINQQPNNVPALLGKACIAHQRNDYKTSLFFYKKALKFKPDSPADVRLGIAHCFLRLGDEQKARAAFQRAFDLDRKCVGAIVGLALLSINTHVADNVKEGVTLLGRAYKLDDGKCNAMVLNHLANHFFFKKEHGRVQQLATHAFLNSFNDAMRAESTYQIGRNHHAQGNLEQAYQFYFQSTQFAASHPKFVLPWYGIGQLYIERGDLEHAMTAFAHVLKTEPENYEASKILGSLYAHAEGSTAERRQLARQLFKCVVHKQPDDVEAWIDYAQLLEEVDMPESLRSYERVVDLLCGAVGMEEAAPEIYINMGSLHFAMQEETKAKECFVRALRIIEADGDSDELQSLKLTCSYNLARVEEALGEFCSAEARYKAVLECNRSYVDCYMRLGLMARRRGLTHDAVSTWKEALAVDMHHLDTWSLLAWQHFEAHEWGPAQKKYEAMLARSHNEDAYALCGLGNIWLEQLHTIPRGEHKEKYRKLKARAIDLFMRALKLHPNCIWAAHGVGCVLAHEGEHGHARDIFSQVREATPHFLHVWVNIAHIYVQQKQYTAAQHMYHNCMVKFNEQCNVDLLLYLSRAYLLEGKVGECKAMLLRARLIAPNDTLVLFNLALVLKTNTLRLIGDAHSAYDDIMAAHVECKMAHSYFTLLVHHVDSTSGLINRHIDRHQANAEARLCQDILSQMPHHIERARARDERDRHIRREQCEQRDMLVDKGTKQALEHRENTQRNMEMNDAKRQQFVNETKDIRYIPHVEEAAKERTGGRGRRRKEHDDFVDDGGGSGDEQGERRAAQPRRDDEALSSKQRLKIRSKAYVSSSSGSSGEEEKVPPPPTLTAVMSSKGPTRGSSSSDTPSASDDGGGENDVKARRRRKNKQTREPSTETSDEDPEPPTAAQRRIIASSTSEEGSGDGDTAGGGGDLQG